MSSRRHTLAFYNAHPRQFEQDRAAWDERELEKHEAEQDALEAQRDERDERRGWELRTDIPRGAPPVSKQQPENPESEAA